MEDGDVAGLDAVGDGLLRFGEAQQPFINCTASPSPVGPLEKSHTGHSASFFSLASRNFAASLRHRPA